MEGESLADDVSQDAAGTAGARGQSWANRLPPSLAPTAGSVSPKKSPGKSPAKSPGGSTNSADSSPVKVCSFVYYSVIDEWKHWSHSLVLKPLWTCANYIMFLRQFSCCNNYVEFLPSGQHNSIWPFKRLELYTCTWCIPPCMYNYVRRWSMWPTCLTVTEISNSGY